MDLNTIHNYMLQNLSNDYDKTVGFPSYDFTRAFAAGIQWLDARTDAAWDLLNVNKMEGTFLDAWCYQRKGLTRKRGSMATATLTATLSTTPVQVSTGTIFATADGLQFAATDNYTLTSSSRTFQVMAIYTGEEYNVGAGTITIIPVQVQGITAVTNTNAASGGDDGEDDDEFRNRYYLAVENGANGTNAGSYIDWACEIPGVHYAKCLSATPTAGQCKVLIVDEHGNPATSLVSTVQSYIDPNQNGDGAGKAPMGCICTVAAPQIVTVVATINSYTGAVSEDDIEQAIYDFAADNALKTDTFSYPKLMSYLLRELPTLQDIDLYLNGARESVIVGENKVAEVQIGAAYIKTQPSNWIGSVGAAASFSIVAVGNNLTYQWQLSTNGGTTWQNSTAAGNATPTLSTVATAARNGYQYRCEVTSGEYIIYSQPATLTVG